MNVKSKSKHRNYVAPAQCVKSPPYLLGNTCLRRRSYGFAKIIHKPGCTFKSFRPAQGKIFYLLFGLESDHCIATKLSKHFIDVTLNDEDAFLKVVDIVADVADSLVTA